MIADRMQEHNSMRVALKALSHALLDRSMFVCGRTLSCVVCVYLKNEMRRGSTAAATVRMRKRRQDAPFKKYFTMRSLVERVCMCEREILPSYMSAQSFRRNCDDSFMIYIFCQPYRSKRKTQVLVKLDQFAHWIY